jgi:hypothetical protein
MCNTKPPTLVAQDGLGLIPAESLCKLFQIIKLQGGTILLGSAVNDTGYQ